MASIALLSLSAFRLLNYWHAERDTEPDFPVDLVNGVPTVAGAAALTGASSRLAEMRGRPLRSIVSMGSRHPIPHQGVDCCSPLDLIQWVYQMERDRKVRSADITVPARPKMWKIRGNLVLNNKTPNKPLTSSMALRLHGTNVQRSLARPDAVRELHERKTNTEDVN
ncbi:proprotein convertase subtilisin/kexin type 4-like protein [Lates japonicus]|uniref:Proprotein convertase subtilisin/kexin type 4-like protein n=1 Tax=Lates japonicus TaxID=270547 RepID=A0AAD3QWG4_LATJO|nr:proprotein convertase subtilisin/kexin type 4-like protein [Lates japonicus]